MFPNFSDTPSMLWPSRGELVIPIFILFPNAGTINFLFLLQVVGASDKSAMDLIGAILAVIAVLAV